MALGSLAKGFTQGFSLADATIQNNKDREYRRERDQVEDQRWNRQMRTKEEALQLEREEARRERLSERQDRLREAAKNGIMAAHAYVRERGIADPSEMTERDRKAVRGYLTRPFRDLQIRPEFFATPEAERAVEVGDRLVQTGDMSVFNDQEARRAAGEAAVGGFVADGKKEKARSGKPRKKQEVHDVTPVPGKEGMVAVETLVSDGDDEYTAPVTEGRKADAKNDRNVKPFPMEQLMERFLGFRNVYQGLEGAGLMPYLKASYAGLGGDPEELDAGGPEFSTMTVKEGNQLVTYRTEDGKRVGDPIATAPRWKPDDGSDRPNSVEEFEYAKSQGYEGTYEDWAQGGGRPKGSMTSGQRLDEIKEVERRRIANRHGLRVVEDFNTGKLKFVSPEDDQRAVRKAEAEFADSIQRALDQDERGELVSLPKRGEDGGGGGGGASLGDAPPPPKKRGKDDDLSYTWGDGGV